MFMQLNQEDFRRMNIVTEIKEWRNIRKSILNKSIGFIPTMGNLHAGHISLCNNSLNDNEVTVVSIFVNPAQFNNKNDFNLYPRTIEQDIKLLSSYEIDYVFIPDRDSMYSDNYQVQVSEIDISRELEGEFRPGHFTGMLTIVLKLLNLVQPKNAYFGEKDYQQLLLIRKMAEALFLPIKIVSCETVRADDGLALSSRNLRLSADQRIQAAFFPKLLNTSLDCNEVTEKLILKGFKVDYIVDKWQRRLGAVWLNDVRLIDNFSIE